MPAYLFATVKNVKDRRGMEEYWSRAGATFEGFGAKHLAIYTPFKLHEGKGPVEAIVAIEFPDMETAQLEKDTAYEIQLLNCPLKRGPPNRQDVS